MSDDSSEDAEFTGHEEEENGVNSDDDDDDDDNDEPIPEDEETTTGRRAKKRVSYVGQDEGGDNDEDEDESDDDEDIPLSDLVSKANKKNGNDSKKKKAPAKAKEPPKKKAKTASNGSKKAPPAKKASSNSVGSSKSYDYASAALYGTECDKGKLIQNLLRRWWYAYEWPSQEVAEKAPPEHYDKLDGFPGVFICTSGDNVGHILDERDPDARPCFEVFAKKSTEELKGLLSKAIEGQLKALREHEHEHDTTSVQNELKKLQKWVSKVAAAKADKEAAKVLKANKLKLKEE